MIQELFIPWIFVFAIVYGSLDVSGIFKNKRVNAIIALVIATVTVSSQSTLQLVWQILPYAGILFAAIFFISFLTAPFRKKESDPVLILIAAALVLILLTNFPQLSFLPYWQDLLPVAGLILIMLIFYAVYKIKSS